MGEIPADQQRPFFGECLVAQQIGAHLFESTPEKLADILVASSEFGPQLPQQASTSLFGKSHDVGANLAGALAAHEMKRPEQDALAVRIQCDVGAFDVDGFHGMIGATEPAR